jgi:hypothetical protein
MNTIWNIYKFKNNDELLITIRIIQTKTIPGEANSK